MCPAELHGIDLESIKACAHGGVILAKLASFGLVLDLEHSEPKGATRYHDWPKNKNSALREMFLKIARVLLHQEILVVRNVLGKRGARRDELEEVMSFVHAEAF